MIAETTSTSPDTSTSFAADMPMAPNYDQSSPISNDEQDKFFNFNEAYPHLVRLKNDWDTEVEDTEVRRKTRDIEVDVEGLRQKGDLDEDETLIPVRTIDVNIQREQPAYINYLKNSRRLMIFRSLDNPAQDPQQIELEFTRGMTYCGWETPLFKELDGTQTHGWDAVEVVYDESKPLNVGLEHIGHDKLLFPRSVHDIQQASRLLRCYDVTIQKLREWVKEFGFDPIQVQYLIDKRKDTQKEAETERIYKLFFKKAGVVYTAWCSLREGCSDWLKKPTKLFVGIKNKQQVLGPMGINEQWQDSDINLYPIFILPYRETEKPKITDHKGRVFMDEAKQEAQTAILSGYVNGLTRASNVFSSPSQESGDGSSLKELEDVKLSGGRILSKPMIFWSPPYPDPSVLRTLEYFDTSNSQETNQINFAAMNRQDTRKTAKEIDAAQSQQSLMNSVPLTLYSTHIREVYSFAWLIVQSQALQNKIHFLLKPIQVPIPNMINGAPTGQTQTVYQNDIETISQSYELRSAGDIDVIQRQEKVQQMKQDWPVIANTALKDTFLADLIQLEYPDKGEQYAAILKQGDQMQMMKSMIARLATVLQGALQQNPQMVSTMPQQERAELGQLMQEAMAFTGQPPTGPAQQGGNNVPS